MTIDTTARIAILGAGPIGLEAALYARLLGYDVRVYEKNRLCENMLRWGHVRLFSPIRSNRSTLAMAMLRTEYPDRSFAQDDDYLSGRELVEDCFLPLSQTALLADRIHLHTEVVGVSREKRLKAEAIGKTERSESPFRILVRTNLKERIELADVVIDTTGTYGNPNWLGQGGIPAVGETVLGNRQVAQHSPPVTMPATLEYGLPDILGAQQEQYANRRVLVVGSGYSAATSVVALARLTQQFPKTEILWVTRRATREPIVRIADDRLPNRDALAAAANQLASGLDSRVMHLGGLQIDALLATDSGVRVTLSGDNPRELVVDQLIANVGYRPNLEIIRELQVHQCYATEGPIKLAASLLENTSADCLDQANPVAEALRNPEPNFYILGSKSFGRSSQFLLSLGREQIRDVFSLIGGRKDLDLYKTE